MQIPGLNGCVFFAPPFVISATSKGSNRDFIIKKVGAYGATEIGGEQVLE